MGMRVIRPLSDPLSLYTHFFHAARSPDSGQSFVQSSGQIPQTQHSSTSITSTTSLPPFVILHGLLGNTSNWSTIGRKLTACSALDTILAMDARNHGRSPHANTMTWRQMADDVLHTVDEMMDDLHGKNKHAITLCGHSMGGKTAMTVALTAPERVHKLIVIDIAPSTYAHNQQQWRSVDTIVQAMSECDTDSATDRREVEEVIEKTVHDSATRAFVMQNLVYDGSMHEGKGGWKWRVNVESIRKALEDLRHFEIEEDQQTRKETSRTFTKPALFIAGGKSGYLKGEERRKDVSKYFPNARIETIEEAGHWIHAEAPEKVVQLICEFMKETN